MRQELARTAIIGCLLISGCDAGEITNPEAIQETEQQPAQVPPRPITCEYGEVSECGNGEGTKFCDLFDHDLRWGECLADFACLPGEARDCDLGETVYCQLYDGVPEWPSCPFTPLVLSFEVGAPIEMLASDAVFDIAGVGECLDSDWPSAATPWLAVDLDRNGFIDAGHELFGSGSMLASGRQASNGFVALAPFDGDHDGRITPADPRFEELLVWRDEDADKRSLPHELMSLAEAGVQAIELDVHVREQCDARGNCGRERSRFEYVAGSGQTAVGEVVDMYLACD